MKGQIETRGLLRALRYAIERKILEEALFAEKERAQVSLKCIGDAVICTDIAGRITFLNLVAERTTGWSFHEAEGRPRAEVLRILDGMGAGGLRRIRCRWRSIWTRPCTCRRAGSSSAEVASRFRSRARPLPIHDREGKAAGAVIVFRDVSAARALALQMTHAAEHDFLTGLPNRMLLNDRVGQAIALAPRHGKKVAVLFLDLDGFKHINDSLGHSIGDKLLQSIARRLVANVRAPDTVSRQGGDEFVVLLSEVERWEDAAEAAKRMLRDVAEPHAIDQHELHVTASIGISVYPDDGLDAETLIKNADTAMYQAKANGAPGPPVLQAGHVPPGGGAAVDRGGPAPRPRTAGVRSALPAEGPSRDGSASPAPRRCSAGRIPRGAWCRRPSSFTSRRTAA